MTKPRAYVTRLIPERAIDRLRWMCDVEVNPYDRPLTREELLEAVKGRDAVLSMITDGVDGKVYDAALPSCKVFANYAVGYNNLDIPAATERGILVTNTPGVLTNATADMAWALLLATARRLVEGDRETRERRFTGWAPLYMLGMEVSGKTLGVVGAGRIGQAFAQRASGFDMKVLYTARTQKPEFEARTGSRFVEMDVLLRESDFVSLHVPLTPATNHLIGDRELGLMKKTAILVNTARGPVVDEKALLKALTERRIWGAGLDVYEREPELEPGLAELENVVLAPHLGSSTLETREQMGLMAVENIIAALEGRTPPNCVNPEAIRKL